MSEGTSEQKVNRLDVLTEFIELYRLQKRRVKVVVDKEEAGQLLPDATQNIGLLALILDHISDILGLTKKRTTEQYKRWTMGIEESPFETEEREKR